jgi:ABC-2 type transport system ATP-binding protein
MVGLSDNRRLPLGKFSKGMLQRIGIAQALINDPRLVILDEPMSGLDPIGRREVRDIILNLKKDGKTVFFSSHILTDAEMICDRVGILNRGKLINVGRLDEILDARLKYIEVIAEGIGVDVVSKIDKGVMTAGDRIIMRLGKEQQVDEVIELIRGKAGRIISIIPHRESLEDYFIKKVGTN